MTGREEDCACVFCYGSLRPDDDSGMPWTEDAIEGMRGQPATVPGTKLFMDNYAALVFDDDNNSSVVGWVLTANPTLFEDKMKYFDAIEGYKPDGSGLYQRAVVDASLGDPSKSIGEPIGEEGTRVKAFVYHRPDCNKDFQILGGDWLLRNEAKEL